LSSRDLIGAQTSGTISRERSIVAITSSREQIGHSFLRDRGRVRNLFFHSTSLKKRHELHEFSRIFIRLAFN
jgi:hypothetical protein